MRARRDSLAGGQQILAFIDGTSPPSPHQPLFGGQRVGLGCWLLVLGSSIVSSSSPSESRLDIDLSTSPIAHFCAF